MKYPYYIYPDIKALREGDYSDKAEANRLRRRIAANIGDPMVARRILGIDPEDFAHFYPDMLKAQLSTDDTITSFLARFGKEDVEKDVPDAPKPIAEASKTMTDAPQTMADAQLLIKNHDYEAALEIIMRLSLNNPKKSIYFADQIRFLRKLILNESKHNNF